MPALIKQEELADYVKQYAEPHEVSTVSQLPCAGTCGQLWVGAVRNYASPTDYEELLTLDEAAEREGWVEQPKEVWHCPDCYS